MDGSSGEDIRENTERFSVFSYSYNSKYLRCMILLSFYTSDVMLASDIPDINIFTDHDYVDFRLLSGGYPLLEGRYYALNGKATVTDISSLVENYLAGNTDNPLAEFVVEASYDDELAEKEFTALYCNVATGMSDPADWLLQNFLTLTKSRRIAPDDFINLMWYAYAKESLAFRVLATYVDAEGNRGTSSYIASGNGIVASGGEVFSQYIYLDQVCDTIKNATKLSAITLLSVTAQCGDRSLTCFVDKSLADIVPFYYLNCFGVPEHISLPRTTTAKVKCDRSVATLSKTSQFYDVTTSKEYEVESGPLTADECLQVEQMFTSPLVRVPLTFGGIIFETDFDALYTILITDFTSELSDSDEKLNSVKFTWRYADNRPKVNISEDSEVFTTEFNPTFN